MVVLAGQEGLVEMDTDLDAVVASVRRRLEFANPFTRIIHVSLGVGWRAAVRGAGAEGRVHVMPVPFLAVIEPMDPLDELDRRMVAVVQNEDGRLRLDADVLALLCVDDDELQELGKDLIRAADDA